MALEQGYEIVVGKGGGTLSGGQRQRISIAWAIFKDAPIVLLDEATASVDPDNEKHIQLAINELVRNKTLVVIVHRLSTIRNADQILVIDNGRLVQKGVHDEVDRARRAICQAVGQTPVRRQLANCRRRVGGVICGRISCLG